MQAKLKGFENAVALLVDRSVNCETNVFSKVRIC